MKRFKQHIGSLLLLIVFAVKIASPACSSLFAMGKMSIESQEEKSDEDKSGEKSFSYANELAEISPMHTELAASLITSSIFSRKQCSFLPFQYFSIPTPPPWDTL